MILRFIHVFPDWYNWKYYPLCAVPVFGFIFCCTRPRWPNVEVYFLLPIGKIKQNRNKQVQSYETLLYGLIIHTDVFSKTLWPPVGK